MVGLYYGKQVDYASLLSNVFAASNSHSKMKTEISNARFPHIFILKLAINDPLAFPTVGQIPDAILNLV